MSNIAAFNTQYSFSSSSQNKSEHKDQTDTSDSFGGSTEGSVYFGGSELKNAKLSVTVKVAGGRTFGESSINQNSSYRTVDRSINATSGFSDYLYFTVSRMNLFIYPMVGLRCPDYTLNCEDNQKLQRYFQYSGPDLISNLSVDATTQQWYQPVQEPGNVFSYPWNLQIMQVADPAVLPVVGQRNAWTMTDTTQEAVKTQWSSGASVSETIGQVDKWNVAHSTTVTGRISVGKFPLGGGGVDLSGTFSYAHSSSFQSQNTGTYSLDSSTGFQVNKPGFDDEIARQYFYYFSSYVLSTNAQICFSRFA